MSAKGGAPSKYDPAYCEQLLQYFSIAPYYTTEKTIIQNGEKFKIPVTEANDMPTYAGFACEIGVHRETLINWTKDFPEFFDAYKRAKEYQERFLIINGQKGLINSAFGIFTAKNVLGWKDRQPEEVPTIIQTNDIKPVTDEQLERLVVKAREIK
jgi:hypothetical protein